MGKASRKYVGKSIRTKLRRRQRDICAECGEKFNTRFGGVRGAYGYRSVDHKIPLQVGGTNDIWNLELVHPKCNELRNIKFHYRHQWLHRTNDYREKPRQRLWTGAWPSKHCWNCPIVNWDGRRCVGCRRDRSSKVK